MSADASASARFLGAFFDDLCRWGVGEVVLSPGSRSTPLAMCAYELSRRCPQRLRLFVDVDERGAAFFALGLAKAGGRPAALVCTSGTAVANYYPAVLEAESSRVPLIVLTGDRPPRLQGLGAPQTCDQLNAYGAHVRAFRQMPLPSSDPEAIAFARQAAREACIAAGASTSWEGSGMARLAGACAGGPVHLNFPFDEPLKPKLSLADLFEGGRRGSLGGNAAATPPAGRPDCGSRAGFPDVSRETSVPMTQNNAILENRLAPREASRFAALFAARRTLVLAGEGSCSTFSEAREVLGWAADWNLPLMADPLSGLRSAGEDLVIDNYDSVLGPGGTGPEELVPEVVVRFGRYPVSKKATSFVEASGALQLVVDAWQTRDFNCATDCYCRCAPIDFVRSFAGERPGRHGTSAAAQASFASAWIRENEAARRRIETADAQKGAGGEGAFVRRMLKLLPEGSCLFAANSMSVRALDTFYLKGPKRLTLLCNRGLNGIDGTLSTALGAAQHFEHTALLTGDLALLHDVNALALQRELRLQRQAADVGDRPGRGLCPAPNIVVVLLNNGGGGIFDMLPQRSDDPYFERLFLTPQEVDFSAAAAAFGVPYARADSVEAFDRAFSEALGVPGVTLVEIPLELGGLAKRYAPYWAQGDAARPSDEPSDASARGRAEQGSCDPLPEIRDPSGPPG